MKLLNSKFIPYVMWSLPLFFFAYQFLLRLWPSLMVEQITTQYAINSSEFGILAAYYYCGYAGMQIPTAILFEKYGSRKIISLFMLIAGIAAVLFTLSNMFYVALMSRFLIGVGSVVGFLGVSKMISEWFPKEAFSKMLGISYSIGFFGAVYGGKPLNVLIDTYYWKNVALAIAAGAIFIGIMTFCVLRDNPKKHKESLESNSKPIEFSLNTFKTLLAKPSIWLIAISGFLFVGALEGFADVWGVPYLMKAFSIDKSTAAGLVSFIFIGMLAGGYLLSTLSKKIGNNAVLIFSGISISLIFALFLFAPFYSWYLFASILFILGIFCCYQVNVFAAGAQLVPNKLLGVTIAFLNCMIMLGGAFFHSVIGRTMDLLWSGKVDSNGLRIYDLITIKQSLAVIPISALVGAGLILTLAIKSKKNASSLVLEQTPSQTENA